MSQQTQQSLIHRENSGTGGEGGGDCDGVRDAKEYWTIEAGWKEREECVATLGLLHVEVWKRSRDIHGKKVGAV